MSPASIPAPLTRAVQVSAAGVVLDGDLTVPTQSRGVVLFSHGSGSGRMSPRNRAVARTLQDAGFATLLLDLLTRSEETLEAAGGTFRFDVSALAERLDAAAVWLGREPSTCDLPLGLFGASTGAASALIVAAARPALVRAIVSRGGRPDLAGAALHDVQAPTRLIVGSADTLVVDLNRRALAQLRCPKDLILVHNATHLFEEAGALEEVARLASEWFGTHASARRPATADAQGLQRSRSDAEC